MQTRASRTGLMVSALGGMATVIAVFLPWYGVGITPAAVDFVSGAIGRLIPQFAGSSLDAQLRNAGQAAAGHQVAGVTAHQAFSGASTVLLLAGGAAIALAMVPLARTAPATIGGAGPLVALGAVAAGIVIWHMVNEPNPAPGLITVSLRGGAWLSLAGALAIAAGGLWPARGAASAASPPSSDVWSELSGWTPTA